MSITKLPRPSTPTGRLIQQAVRSIRPKTTMGKIGVALGAEIGGVVGDQAHRILGSFVSDGSVGTDTADGSREAQRRARREAYTEQARRIQQEARRRAEEAFRQAQAGGAGGDGGHRASTGSPGTDHSGMSGTRTYRYRGRVVADYYEVLEVSPKARQSVIDKAYRALMREVHPDLGGDPAKARLINEAYEVLRDPVTRCAYDKENALG